MIALLVACTSEPVAWRAIRVGEHTIGAERITDVRSADGTHLRREVRLSLPDGERTIQADLHADATGRAGDAWVLELVAPTLDGARDLAIVDPYDRTVRAMRVVRTGDDVHAEGEGVTVALSLADGRVVRARRGPVEAVAVDAEPVIVPYDPATFEIAVARTSAPNAHRAEFRLDGATVIVETPIALEVADADRARLSAWVDAVRDAGDCQRQAAALADLATREGVGARVVEGWVYVDDGTPALVPHAWVEVALGDRIVAVDPALGQPVAPALRLPAPPGEAWFAGHAVELVTAR